MQTPLKAARVRAGKNLREVAASVGIDFGNLSRIERGAQTPSVATAEKLARYFGTVSEIEILYPERYVKVAPKRTGQAA